MAVIRTGSTIFLRKNISNLRRSLDTVDLEELPDSRERKRAPVLCPSCEGQAAVLEMFSDNSYLSAILDRQRLLVAAPRELTTQKAENFYATATAGLLVQAKEKEPQDRCGVPDCCNEELQATRSYLATTPCMLGRGRAPKSSAEKPSYFGTRNRNNLVVEEGTISPEKKKYHCQWTFLRGTILARHTSRTRVDTREVQKQTNGVTKLPW